MKTLKRKTIFMPAIVLASLLAVAISCEEMEESAKENGKKAAAEFCDCYETNSKDDCLEKLKKKYDNYGSQDFLDAFNEAETCDVELVWIPTGSSK
jgi:hypothetical protein